VTRDINSLYKFAGMTEPLESPDFRNRDHCRQELEAFETEAEF
jgi:hypothetical protein